MTDEEWSNSSARCLGMFLAGGALGEDDDRGQPLFDDDFILLLNGHHEQIDFAIPDSPTPGIWNVVIDTFRDDAGSTDERTFSTGAQFPLQGRSLVLLIRSKQPPLMRDSRTLLKSAIVITPAEQTPHSA
jgi:glycogen operon protein